MEYGARALVFGARLDREIPGNRRRPPLFGDGDETVRVGQR